jgi:histone acetyltransferase (RNA polymerase elongator complex component)
MLKKNYNPAMINIVDPTFIGSGKEGLQQFKSIGSELLKLNTGIKFSFEVRPDQIERESFSIWKQVGIEVIHLGVESGYPPALKLFNKRNTYTRVAQSIDIFESLKIPFSIGFIMFHPWTTIEEIIVNIEYSRTVLKSKNIIGLFNTLRMYAGSELSKKWKGNFSPYPISETYFIDPKTKMFFSKLVSKDIANQLDGLIKQNKINRLYEYLLKLAAEV